MKFGTDMGEYGKWFCKYFKVCQLFSFSSYATLIKAFDDYVTLNISLSVHTYSDHAFTIMHWNY